MSSIHKKSIICGSLIFLILFSAFLLGTSLSYAQDIAKPVALGSANAKKGGTLTVRMDTYPKTLNYFTSGDVYAGVLAVHVMETLAWTDYATFEPVPFVAESWKYSANKLKLTFKLNPAAKFSDGSPLTADDVIFTWDTIFDPKVNAANNRAYLDAVKSWRKIDSQTVEFEFKSTHFQNLERVGGVYILQKSFYGAPGKNFNKDFNNVVKGSGPYVLDEKALQRNRKIVLTRNPQWWGSTLPWAKGLFNFDKLVYNILKDDRVAFEDFKKGNLSFFNFISAGLEMWAKETNTPDFTGKKFAKLTYPYANPASWGGLALNMRRQPLKDLKFREALQYVFNQKLYIDKLFFGLQIPIRGPFTNFSPYASPNLKSLEYNPAKTASLLKELGYTTTDKNGVLVREKDGQKAELSVLYSYEPHEKYLTVFKEDAKKVGISINLQFMEWAAAMKLVDDWKFDALVIAWAANPIPEPEQLWLSKFASEKSSSNYPGFVSEEADKLMYEAGSTFDVNKRMKLYHRIEETIVAQHPYLWRWQQKDHFFAYNVSKVAIPEKIWKFTGDTYRQPTYVYWWDASVK